MVGRIVIALLFLALAPVARAGEPRWTMKDGLTIALHPQAIDQKGAGGPRGLIRVGLPLRPEETTPGLLNFIAIEPVTRDGKRGFSELEKSPSDGKQGLIFRADAPDISAKGIRFTIRTEKFQNGAHPYVIAELTADHPNEVKFQVFAEADSAPMKQCILTATMGNMQRLRRLHLADRIATPSELFKKDPGPNFTPHAMFELSELKRDADGVFVAADSDEIDARVLSKTLSDRLRFWAYAGVNFVQYWRQPEPVDPDLVAVVNARKMYWRRDTPVPGGLAFENFELNAPFHEGQAFIFGVKSPEAKK
jgi:hypothetical protein